MSPYQTPDAAALPVAETADEASIQQKGFVLPIKPLGNQLIIRTLPPDSIGSILVPDSAKAMTLTGSKETKASHYIIEADVYRGVKDILQGHIRKDAGAIVRGFLGAKTNANQANLNDAVHFVEAEVIAVGPGKRFQDRTILKELAYCLENPEPLEPALLASLLKRARDPQMFMPPIVQVGDLIHYHPAVQRFDRDITDIVLRYSDQREEDLKGSRFFLIREESVLAVIER
jgi:co-chaperonin GroES (HSP10)